MKGGGGREWETAPGFEYTSKKSPAAIEKSPKDGRLQGSTSGMETFASWLSWDQVLENWCTHGQMVKALTPLLLHHFVCANMAHNLKQVMVVRLIGLYYVGSEEVRKRHVPSINCWVYPHRLYIVKFQGQYSRVNPNPNPTPQRYERDMRSTAGTYWFKMKLEASSINMLNSFPWQVYPRWAISKASLPRPAPGTRMETVPGSTSLEQRNENWKRSYRWTSLTHLHIIRWESADNLIDDRLVAQTPFLSSFFAPVSKELFNRCSYLVHVKRCRWSNAPIGVLCNKGVSY